MEPKIADFGLSRLFEQNKTQTCATFLSGSLGYMAPEYLIGQIVTAKADIYNLGVIIIEIITGSKVINNWRNRPGGASSEADRKQIKYCLDIALGCIKFNREERPTSREIIERLDRWETTNCNVNSETRPAADQILTHTEEKASVSTTGYESIFCALQPNTTDVRSTAAADDNSNTNTGAGPRPYDDSQNGWRALSLFHRQLWRLLCKDSTEEFTFAQMEAATMGFSLEAKIGEGSFGTVYRGYLPDGREVAIKRGESGPRDDRRFQESEFLSKVAFLSRLRHKHLVGYCAENDERLLVSEYMRNGALYDHLHLKAAPSSPPSLVMSSWKLRIRILLDVSRGVEYMHMHSFAVLPIIHGDVKSSNILLDASWRARLSDLGPSVAEWQARTREPRTVAGTVGYMDPEYYSLHHLTVKSDVYSFGVVMLEVLTGKPAILEEAEGASPLSVVDYAVPSIVSGELGKILDPRVPEPAAHEAEALGLVAYIAVHCVQLQGKDRPGMEGIVANLQTAFDLCEGSFDGDLV